MVMSSSRFLRSIAVTAGVSVAIACGGGGGPANPSGPTPSSYSVLGTWSYTETEGSSARDRGVIAFTGSSGSGSYTLRNVYDVEYSGTFTFTGNVLRLQGTKRWTGAFEDANRISGSWEDTLATGVRVTGTFAATRQ